jgi:hypothetical protein
MLLSLWPREKNADLRIGLDAVVKRKESLPHPYRESNPSR